ncbi:MAG: hypothetical protein M3R17_00390 [Bacteroidota bacterium]|nr:hypothetical protein [Bacteroidota bacterium]
MLGCKSSLQGNGTRLPAEPQPAHGQAEMTRQPAGAQPADEQAGIGRIKTDNLL